MSFFRLYGLYGCTELKIKVLRKSLEFVLKIAPIGVPEFGGAEKTPYLCTVESREASP